MRPSHGWLSRRPDIRRDGAWFGLDLEKSLPTRWEEYTFARSALRQIPKGWALDAGCGHEPRVHMMPLIAANEGWSVDAIDLKDGKYPMIPHPAVKRGLVDMLHSGYEDEAFDVILSISVIEHLDPITQRPRMFSEIERMTKPGGWFIGTFDGMWPKVDLPSFDLGKPVIPDDVLKNDLGWPVAYVLARKR